MTETTQTTPAMPEQLEWLRPAELIAYGRNSRTHSRKQVAQIVRSIESFGFTNPVLASDDGAIIAGHGRVEAAKILGLDRIPVLRLSHLSDAERRAYILADNKIAEQAGWDREVLAIELQGLIDLEFDLEITGFEIAEVDILLEEIAADQIAHKFDEMPTPPNGPAVTCVGDLWVLGSHRLYCGDAQESRSFEHLLGSETIDMVFTDPPYNVPINGHVTGKGRYKHREFAFASGEMGKEAFVAFLTTTLGNAAEHCRDGAIAFVCMDWRHMGELLAAGEQVFSELKNLCVWNKTNAGMGSFYRSKHELVFAFKVGTATHVNSFGLGENGRYRTNVWDYPGVNIPGAESQEALAMHPTVKPVAMITDAIKDCSGRNGLILDIFGGSGSTLIAAESCGRSARLIECDPVYCDTILERFQRVTGDVAVHAKTGRSWGT